MNKCGEIAIIRFRKGSHSNLFALNVLLLRDSVTLDSKPLEIERLNYTEFGTIGFCVRPPATWQLVALVAMVPLGEIVTPWGRG